MVEVMGIQQCKMDKKELPVIACYTWVWFGRWNTKNASQIIVVTRRIVRMKGEEKNTSRMGSECHFKSSLNRGEKRG
jgi:hypothetical protein